MEHKLSIPMLCKTREQVVLLSVSFRVADGVKQKQLSIIYIVMNDTLNLLMQKQTEIRI